MIQTLNIYNYPWIQGHINEVVYDLEQNGCKVKDIRAIGLNEGILNQIIFESDQLITYKVNFTREDSVFTIFDHERNVIAKYNQYSF